MMRLETSRVAAAYISLDGFAWGDPWPLWESNMVRNITGFAAFAFVALMAWKLLTAVFGGLIGLVLTLLWWAFLGFVIYTILKMFSPSTAQKVRETIRGNSTPAA